MPEVNCPRVGVVVLNNNRPAATLECLASLKRNTYRNLGVILLDFGARDALKDVQTRFPEVSVHWLDRNLGYAGNNNFGIQLALAQQAQWILILNDDTVVAPDCVSRLVEAGSADSRIGLVGPTIYHYDEPTIIQSAGGRLDRLWNPIHIGRDEVDEGQYYELQSQQWLSGCALLIRSELIRQIGSFDERLFMYWEDTDLSLRAREKGWRLRYAPQARIWHKGVQRYYVPQPYVSYYSTRNQFVIYKKHHAPATVFSLQMLQTLRTLLSWSFRRRWQSKREHRDALWQGLRDFARGRLGERVRER